MPVGSDFNIIQFSEHLGANKADLDASWATFVGNQTSVKNFNIDNPPQGEGYLLIQTLNVGVFSHRIFINGFGLNGYNLPQHAGWTIWMVTIQDGVLLHGANSLQIMRDEASKDSFVVGHVVVHWREVVNIEAM